MKRSFVSSARAPDHRGFTLIELMIVLVVMGILAAIAYPSLSAYVIRARRADAKAVLLEATAWMERNYVLNNNSYMLGTGGVASANTALVSAGYNVSPRGGATTHWNIAFTAITASTYTLEASPTDTAHTLGCDTLTINELGVRDATGPNPADCWTK